MVWKLVKNDSCPTCGAKLEGLNKKNKVIGYLILEILFFGSLGLFIFGEGIVEGFGEIIFGVWV